MHIIFCHLYCRVSWASKKNHAGVLHGTYRQALEPVLHKGRPFFTAHTHTHTHTPRTLLYFSSHALFLSPFLSYSPPLERSGNFFRVVVGIHTEVEPVGGGIPSPNFVNIEALGGRIFTHNFVNSGRKLDFGCISGLIWPVFGCIWEIFGTFESVKTPKFSRSRLRRSRHLLQCLLPFTGVSRKTTFSCVFCTDFAIIILLTLRSKKTENCELSETVFVLLLHHVVHGSILGQDSSKWDNKRSRMGGWWPHSGALPS